MDGATAGATEGDSELIADSTACQAVIFDDGIAEDRHALDQLRADPRVEFLDHRSEQIAALRVLRPAPTPRLVEEPTRWAYYPWRRTVVGILGPGGFRAVRLDRNRHLITAGQQARLGGLCVGVAGLSVGHVIAHTLVAQGLCGALKVADFDSLELSNLNRVPATVLDLGLNKATLAARRIAELDPYVRVEVLPTGVTADTVGSFLDGVDVVVEECDSLDMKVVVRREARRRRLPVLMSTSDRGLVDVERFDLDTDRPVLHGLIGDVDATALAGMAVRDKIPYMLAHLDVPHISAKAAASMVEVGHTLTTWPQLAGEVILGAAAVAEAVRRIGLGEDLPSGRVRIDIAGALDGIVDPATILPPTRPSALPPTQPSALPTACRPEPDAGTPAADLVAAAAMRAPSGGNAQPWDIEIRPDAVVIRLASQYTSTMDVGSRGAAIAVGAALFNARVAAAAHGVLGPVELHGDDGARPLTAVLNLADPTTPGSTDPALANWYGPMVRRGTNRNPGTPGYALDADTAATLEHAARAHGGWLRLLTSPADIESVAALVADADRLRYLTPRLHAEMLEELRFPGDPDQDTGIDVATLELDFSDRAVLEILRRPDVMTQLTLWDAGAALGEHTRDLIRASAALAVVVVAGDSLMDYANGGSAAEAVWVAAESLGLAVHPVSPMFIHARTDSEIAEMSPAHVPALRELRQRFNGLAAVAGGESLVIMFRLAVSPPASVRSRRSFKRIRRR